MSVLIDFLANTRSKSFDYAWLYSFGDPPAENELTRHIGDWLSTNLLDTLPPVVAFTLFKGRCALVLGRKSPTRQDPTNRAIFERALFVWDAKAGLRYSHLVPLRQLLEKEAQRVFSEVPNDQLRPKIQARSVAVEPEELDLNAAREREPSDAWNLPSGLGLQDLIRGGLTVEVPAQWSFQKMLSPLGEAVIKPGEVVSVAESLTYRYCALQGDARIISGAISDHGSLPRLRDSFGNILTEEGVTRMRERWRGADQKNRAREAVPRITPPTERTSTPLPGAGSSETPRDFEEAVLLSQKLDTAQNESWWRRRSAEDDIPVALKRLRFHIGPIGRLVGPDVLLAWQNLLQEIQFSYEAPTPGMLDEWMRRLNTLRQFVAHFRFNHPVDWAGYFDEAYNSLYNLLDDLRYR